MPQREHERTPATLARDPAGGSRAWRLDRAGAYLRDSHRLRQIGLPLTVVALFAVFALTSDVFFTVRNFQNVGLAAAALALVSAGQCFVVLTAGIDLSVGSTAALVSVVGAIAMRDGGLAAGVAAGLFTGLGVGIVNALVVTVLGVAPFVATLAMLSIASGLALSISGGTPITGVPEAFSDLAGQRVAGIPVLAVFAIALFLVAWLVLRFTRFGRYVYAIGGNAEAARLSGIRVAAVTFATYAICSTFAAAGGLVLTARIASGQPTTGTSLALESIAAVVLGGVSLFGGRGSIVGVAFGVVFVTVLANGLNLLGVSSYTQLLVLGAALIAVLAIDRRISGETR